MGFSIATPPSSNTLFSEIAFAEAQAQEGGQETEGLTLPQEIADGKMPGEGKPQGLLKGESKPFLFTKETGQTFSQKLQNDLKEMNRPQQHPLGDAKSPDRTSHFSKETLLKTKEFKFEKLELRPREEKQESSLLNKSHYVARQALEKGKTPPSVTQLKESAILKQQHQTQAKTLENRIHKDYASKSKDSVKTESKKNESKESNRLKEKEGEKTQQEASARHLEKQEEREQQRHRERGFDEEEGFAGGQQENSHQESEQEREAEKKIQKVSDGYIQQFRDYATSDSILSEIFQMRISQFDVLILFMEILKLEIKGREQERISRQEERNLQILHMEKVVENYKTQSTWTMNTSIGAGILGIISGAAPIIGHMKGDWLIDTFGTFLESIRDAKKDQLFKSIHRITNTMSEMQKSVGQIHQTFSEGNRTYDQHMSDIYRSDHEERTRTIDEIKDNWKGIENFLYQTLQMNHDAIRQLYS